MKILLVSMNSLHFRRWTAQLEGAGHEVYWFDSMGAGGDIKELDWVQQHTDWRLRVKKGRYALKKIPLLSKLNEREIAKPFKAFLHQIQPDMVHSFALQISVLPILEVMKEYPKIKWLASTWGSDVYYYEKLGITPTQFRKALSQIDYLFTDCIRDATIVKEHGFLGVHLGVFPGNGGIAYDIPVNDLKKPSDRKHLFIKAYDDAIGRGDVIIQSILEIPHELLKDYGLIFLGISKKGIEMLETLSKEIEVIIYPREKHIDNGLVIKLLSDSYIYIGNSLSDGIPNVLLEAMGNGAFPIQSNPGNVTAEVIENKKNGILIEDPLNYIEIKKLITQALIDTNRVGACFNDNIKTIRERTNRKELRNTIRKAYEQIV